MLKNRRVFSMCLAAVGCGATFLEAADISWNNPAGGSFLVATNWDPATIPGPDDRAIFNLGGTYVLSTGIGTLMNVSNQQMLIGNDNVRYIMGADGVGSIRPDGCH